jgi:hypothetical protein
MADGFWMYSQLASWWYLLSAPEDYQEEAAFYRQQMIEQARVSVRRVL